MTGNLDWDLLQSLHAVLEAGSFSGAAKLRRLTQPTLGRHIDQLERQLGAPLFLRSPRGLQPTDLALSFRPHLEDMNAAANTAARDAAGVASGEGGVVRLTVSDMVGVEVIPEILARFRQAHPGIDIELTLSNRIEDLTRREADIAVRMARPTQNALVARKVGELKFGFYATPEYLAAHGVPENMDDLQERTLIGFDRDHPEMADSLQIGRPISRDLFAFRTDSNLAQFAALRAGVGIGICQHGLGRKYGLVPVLRETFGFSLDVWICMHETLRGSARMRLMFDHLAKELADYDANGS